MAAYHRFCDWLALALGIAAGVVFFAQVAMMCASAFIATFPPEGSMGAPWLSEMTIQGLYWLGFMGAALAVRHRAHLGLDALSRLAPPWGRRALGAVTWVVVAAFSVEFARRGYLFLARTARGGEVLPGSGLPQAPFYWCVVISGAASAAFAVDHLLGLLAGETPRPDPDGRADQEAA
ncbi:MAG: TRAP transporter small permease [Planctomycetes bacterium]|nr:TRAP transporter small permease [Planctomycetota bacterium]